MELVYCHTPTGDISRGYYYCHTYNFGSSKFCDLKASNDRYSRTLLCFRQRHFDEFFYTKEQMRDLKINEILKIDE